MQKREVEVKFFLDDIDRMQRRIAGLGAESQGRVFENNIRYEDDGHNLIKKHSLLRLRQDKKAILTFKSKLAAAGSEFNIYDELEVEVSDFKTMDLILTSVGLQAVQRYEKWRETFILGQTAFYLDTMPYGPFLEIEGQETDIQHYAAQLNLSWQKRIPLNYLEIFEILKQKQRLAFQDLTFENFQSGDLNVGAIVDQLVVGDG
ncbi:MAG: class IV adenylate cyclase [Phycisphaerae bacterium]|nr:class IV adenylate cyclase [Phycisphaerae bacterium]NIX30225.1 CYTH domain-containing protein [Phycisphaerae bacterium]